MVTLARFTRRSALALTLVLLLGVFVTGCSDKDRDKNTTQPDSGTVLHVLVGLSDAEVMGKSNVPSNAGIMSLGLNDEYGNLICESKTYVDGSVVDPKEGELHWLTPEENQCLMIFNVPDEAVEDFSSLMVKIKDNNGKHLGFLTKGNVDKTAWTAGEPVVVDFTPDDAPGFVSDAEALANTYARAETTPSTEEGVVTVKVGETISVSMEGVYYGDQGAPFVNPVADDYVALAANEESNALSFDKNVITAVKPTGSAGVSVVASFKVGDDTLEAAPFTVVVEDAPAGSLTVVLGLEGEEYNGGATVPTADAYVLELNDAKGGPVYCFEFSADGASHKVPYAVAKPWIKAGSRISLTVDKDSIETRRDRIDSLTVWVGTDQSQGCISKADIKCSEDKGVVVDFTDSSMPAYIDADTVAKKIAEAAGTVGGYGIAIVPSPILDGEVQSGTLVLDVKEKLGTYLCQIITGREGNSFTAYYVKELCDTGFGCKDANVTIDATGKVATVTAPVSNVALDSIAYYNGMNIGSIPIYLNTAE